MLDTDHIHLNAEATQAIPPVICLCLMIVDQHHLAIASHSALPNVSFGFPRRLSLSPQPRLAGRDVHTLTYDCMH